MSRLADARNLFKRNQIYSVEPPLEGHRELKYFETAMVDGEIIHAFGKAEGRDMTDRSMPKVVARLEDARLNDYTIAPYYPRRLSEIAVRKKLPMGIARNIESYITGETEKEKTAKQRRKSGGRRRKTRRAKNLR